MTDDVPRNKANKKDTDPIVNAILVNDSTVINQVYEQQFDKIRSMVHNFRHLQLDAEDVFQEGLTRAIVNVRKGSFKGGSAFSTYLYSICHNICLKEYHKRKKMSSAEITDIEEEQGEDNFELLQLILHAKNVLDEPCRTIIEMRFGLDGDPENTRFEHIALQLGINAANARQRFGRCFAKLMHMLQQNKEFNLLTEQS